MNSQSPVREGQQENTRLTQVPGLLLRGLGSGGGTVSNWLKADQAEAEMHTLCLKIETVD